MYIGVNQSGNLVETLRLAEEYLRKGSSIQIVIRKFGVETREHASLEYELYVEVER